MLQSFQTGFQEALNLCWETVQLLFGSFCLQEELLFSSKLFKSKYSTIKSRFWYFRIPPKEMDQFPYSLFVLEHIFLCPLFISIFIGCVILYQHGKVLKRSLMQRWNIPFTKIGPYLLALMTTNTNIWWLSKNKFEVGFLELPHLTNQMMDTWECFTSRVNLLPLLGNLFLRKFIDYILHGIGTKNWCFQSDCCSDFSSPFSLRWSSWKTLIIIFRIHLAHFTWKFWLQLLTFLDCQDVGLHFASFGMSLQAEQDLTGLALTNLYQESTSWQVRLLSFKAHNLNDLCPIFRLSSIVYSLEWLM